MYYCISMKQSRLSIKKLVFFIILTGFFCPEIIYSQLKEENLLLKYGSWALLQCIPSPVFYDDSNEEKAKLKFGLQWHVVPVSYSFNTNKYVSPLNFLFIKPNKRFSGSIETYFEPSFIPGGFRNNNLKKFMYNAGVRLVLPVFHKGEYLAVSAGGGYYNQQSEEKKYEGITYEAGIYSFFGMLGLKFQYNTNGLSRYNIGLYIKYY